MIKASILRKLNVLFYIIRTEGTSLTELSENFTIPKRTVKEDLKTINELMKDEFSMKDYLVSSRQGVISINPAYQQDAVKTAYGLKLSLLKSQVIFNYCVLLITKVVICKDELLDTLFISEAYLAKLTAQLREFLLPYEIEITIENDQYSLTGNELVVRIFSYIFLKDSYQNIEWPFTDISQEDIRKGLPEKVLRLSPTFSNTKRSSLYILHQVLRSRYDHQRYLNFESDPAIDKLIELMVENYDSAYVLHTGGYGEIPQEHFQQELLYFNFVRHFLASDSIPYRTKVELGGVFSRTDDKFCQLSNKIYEAFLTISKFPISEEGSYLYHYYLTIFNIIYALFEKRFEYFLDLLLPKPTFHLDTNTEYIAKIRQVMVETISDDYQANYLSSLLYSLSTSEDQIKIRIYLQMNKDFTAVYVLKNRLRALFNSENIYISDNYSLADIVVTDSLEEVTEDNKSIFYFDSVNNEDAWEHLLILIRRTYIKKRFKKIG